MGDLPIVLGYDKDKSPCEVFILEGTEIKSMKHRNKSNSKGSNDVSLNIGGIRGQQYQKGKPQQMGMVMVG